MSKKSEMEKVRDESHLKWAEVKAKNDSPEYAEKNPDFVKIVGRTPYYAGFDADTKFKDQEIERLNFNLKSALEAKDLYRKQLDELREAVGPLVAVLSQFDTNEVWGDAVRKTISDFEAKVGK